MLLLLTLAVSVADADFDSIGEESQMRLIKAYAQLAAPVVKENHGRAHRAALHVYKVNES
jgi:hypothetical protein